MQRARHFRSKARGLGSAWRPCGSPRPTARLQAQQAAEPPPPWKQGQPAAIADSKLAPVAPPPLPTAADKLPLDKLKVESRLQDRGLCGRRSQRAHAAARRQGHRFRQQPHAGQGARHRREGRQARGEGHRLRSASAERHRPAQGHALHRRALPDLQDREDRGQSRQPAEADRHPGRSAEGRAARLEIPHRRPRREALFPGRRALQHLHALGAARQDLPRRTRRQGPRGLRLRASARSSAWTGIRP